MPKRDHIEDDIVLEDPTPIPTHYTTAIDRLLHTVKRDHPNQWAKIRFYESPNSAYAITRSINRKRRGWEATVRKTTEGSAWLYVRYTGD